MKKALKVIAWTLLSVVLTVMVVISIACYFIFTPERLTPIVRQVVAEFVTCECEIGEVDLTFFSTFPYLGVEIHDVSLIHPIDSLSPDTLASVEKIVLSVQPFDAIHGDIFIKQLAIEGVTANIYISADGRTNYDIITQGDTTVVVEDTTTGWRIRSIGWNEDIYLTALSMSYQNEMDDMQASLSDAVVTLSNIERDSLLGPQLDVQARCINLSLHGEHYINNDRIQLHLPVLIDHKEEIELHLDGSFVQWNDLILQLSGAVRTKCFASNDYKVDMNVTTNTWDLDTILSMLPKSITSSLKEIAVDGDLKAEVVIHGLYNETQMPHVKAQLLLDKGKACYQPLPYDLHHITLDATADIDLNGVQPTNLFIHTFAAQTKQSTLMVKGMVNDLLGEKHIDVQMDVDAPLTDWTYFFPDSMLLTGRTKGTISTAIHMDDLLNMRLEKGVFTADVDLTDIHYVQDSLEVDLPIAKAKVQIPNKSSHKRHVNRSSLSAAIELNAQQAYMSMVNEMEISTQKLYMTAAAAYNKKGENILQQWNPRLVVDLKQGELNLPSRLPEKVYIPSIDFSYSNKKMAIQEAEVVIGKSDLNLKGEIRNIGRWLRHKAVLEGQLEVASTHCDANQLLAWFSAETGSEEQVTSEPIPEQQKDTTMQPFLVPTDVNLALKTHIQEAELFNQVANDLKGGIYINDGTIVFEEMGFVCRAAKLQLTAMYRTPRANHLYVGLDYHMIDVDIDELLSIIPEVEQMVPMLSSFKGQAEFHLAAETYLNSQYKPKMSTLRGAASLTGKDLVVLDSETFSTISKLLLFNKKTENKIDSINAEMTIYKNQIDIYPLCVQMDNYMVALGGRHNTNMTFNYDINVLKPIYLGVNVSGTMDDLKIKLAKCKFAEDFRPHWYQKVDTQSLELRQRIKQSMERNVRIQSTK